MLPFNTSGCAITPQGISVANHFADKTRQRHICTHLYIHTHVYGSTRSQPHQERSFAAARGRCRRRRCIRARCLPSLRPCEKKKRKSTRRTPLCTGFGPRETSPRRRQSITSEAKCPLSRTPHTTRGRGNVAATLLRRSMQNTRKVRRLRMSEAATATNTANSSSRRARDVRATWHRTEQKLRNKRHVAAFASSLACRRNRCGIYKKSQQRGRRGRDVAAAEAGKGYIADACGFLSRGASGGRGALIINSADENFGANYKCSSEDDGQVTEDEFRRRLM